MYQHGTAMPLIAVPRTATHTHLLFMTRAGLAIGSGVVVLLALTDESAQGVGHPVVLHGVLGGACDLSGAHHLRYRNPQ